MSSYKIFLVSIVIYFFLQPAEVLGTSPDSIILKDDPLKMLQSATDRILQIVQETKKQASRDPQAYYQKIDAVLSQIVDLEYFTRGVMATYASARRFKTLTTEEEREAFRDRVERFSRLLKDSLMAGYADALLTFDGERISWEPATVKPDQVNDLILTQIIHAESGKQYHVQYRLRKIPDAGWLVQNLIIEGLNLGEAYRNQFANAVEKNQGNVDFVVENWPKLMSKVTTEATPQ